MKQYERHPLSAGYSDLAGVAWKDFLDNLREHGLGERKITLYEGKILDGWQLYRACKDLGINARFCRLGKGIDPAAFVDTANNQRRHESAELQQQRRERRIASVAEKRRAGESLRQIAEEENVSEMTIRNDLATSTAKGFAVEPPEGKVKGKDGRTTRPAKPKKVSTGHPCPVEPPPEEAEPPTDPGRDGYGNEIPEHLAEVFAARLLAKEALTLGRKLQQKINQLANHPGGQFYRPMLRRTESAKGEGRFSCPELHKSLEAVKAYTPFSAVCPRCHRQHEGQVDPNCPLCKGDGWLTKHALIFAERPHREAVETMGKAAKETKE